MQIIETPLAGLLLIEPRVFGDDRGYFFESYNRDVLANQGITGDFVQDNESLSDRGVLRGLHFQVPPKDQGKLVRVQRGKVWDVVVDIRKSSKTFGHHVAVELSADSNKQLLIPKGFAHGFITLSNTATLMYKVDNYFAPEYDRGIAFDDINLGIDWKISKKSIHLSDSDKKHSSFEKTLDLFD